MCLLGIVWCPGVSWGVPGVSWGNKTDPTVSTKHLGAKMHQMKYSRNSAGIVATHMRTNIILIFTHFRF